MKNANKATEKPPAGYKVRLGAYLGHGKRIVHITAPDGFYFQWDMPEGHPFDARRDTILKLHEIVSRQQ